MSANWRSINRRRCPRRVWPGHDADQRHAGGGDARAAGHRQLAVGPPRSWPDDPLALADDERALRLEDARARARGRPGAACRGPPIGRGDERLGLVCADGLRLARPSNLGRIGRCRPPGTRLRRRRQTRKPIAPTTTTPAAIGPAARQDLLGHVAGVVGAEADAGRPARSRPARSRTGRSARTSCSCPASQAQVMRRTDIERPRNTAFGPCLAKNGSPMLERARRWC